MINAKAIDYALRYYAKEEGLELWEVEGLVAGNHPDRDGIEYQARRHSERPESERPWTSGFIPIGEISSSSMIPVVDAVARSVAAIAREIGASNPHVFSIPKPIDPNDAAKEASRASDIASLKKHLSERFHTTSDPVTDGLYLVSAQLDEILTELRTRRR